MVKNNLPEHWALGDATGGFLCTNNGVRALLGVLSEIFDHIEYEYSWESHSSKPEDLYESMSKYTLPIIEAFKNYKKEDISIFRDQTALKGVRRNINRMLTIIFRKYEEFHPTKLKKYLAELDEEGTKEAKNLIDEIEKKMFNFITIKLKEHYKKDKEWWYEGIPESVRKGCAERHELDKGLKEPEQYLYLIDYSSIFKKNWKDLNLEQYFALTKEGGVDKKLEWISKLNKIRQITHHASKWPLEENDVKFVREIHRNIIDKID